MKSLISIIIPTYNRAYLVTETLDSIISQTYTNWECIIVDDGSIDTTEKVIQEYVKKDNRFQYHKRPKDKPKGANSCRNYGFKVSKGDYIQWFDSDDLMHLEKLKIKSRMLDTNNVDFVVCEGIEYKDTIDNVIYKWDEIYSESVLIDHIMGKVNFHTNGPMFKRAFLDGKQKFNEDLQRKQEWEFYSRLLSFSTNYMTISEPLYYFRIHEKSINGEDSIKTLKSRILATTLVYNIVKLNFKSKELINLKNHFLNKYLLFFKLAIKSKKIELIGFALRAILLHINIKIFVIKILKVIKNPKIIINLFS